MRDMRGLLAYWEIHVLQADLFFFLLLQFFVQKNSQIPSKYNTPPRKQYQTLLFINPRKLKIKKYEQQL